MTPTPFVRRLARQARQIPFSLALTVVIVLAGALAGTLLIWGRHNGTAHAWGAGLNSTIGSGNLISVLAALIIPANAINTVLSVLGAVFLLGWAERRLGSARTAWIWLISGVGGITLGLIVQALGQSMGEVWAEFSAKNLTLDPAIGVVGPLLAASTLAPALWRRRIRLWSFALLAVFVLYNAAAATLYRALAALIGLLIGLLLPDRQRHRLRTPSSHRETRTLVGMLMALTALGPILGLLRHDENSPFSPIVDLVERDRAIPFMLAAILLVALGLARGKLWAYVCAILLNLTIAVFGLARIDYGELFSDHDTPSATIELTIWYITLVLIPVALLVALVLLRKRLVTTRLRHGSNPQELARVRALLRQHGGTMSFMATWDGHNYWFGASGNAVVAYRVINGIALVTGSPICAPDELEETARGFAEFCDRAHWVPVFYSAGSELLPLMKQLGWSRMSVGEETIVHTKDLDFAGAAWANVRNGLRRGEREGLQAVWTRWADLSFSQRSEIVAISEEWVAEKQLPEMGFTLGGLNELDDADVQLMLVVGPDQRIQAVTSWLPSWNDGELVAWTNDFMRRSDEAHPRVMEFVIASTAKHCAKTGIDVMSLSGAPLARKPKGHKREAEQSETIDRLAEFLANALEPAYGFKALFTFKSKFNPEYRTLWMFLSDQLALPAAALAIARAYLPNQSTAQLLRLTRKL